MYVRRITFPGLAAILVLGSLASAQAQEPPQSVAEAARNARERVANSTKDRRIITNRDLGVLALPAGAAFFLPFASPYGAEVPPLSEPACDNSEATRLTMELQAAQQDLDQVRSQLSYQPEVISDNDLDLRQFRPGSSGLYVGAPPLRETEPPAPARVTEVALEERVASLQKALRLACEPPEGARIQTEIDRADGELDLLQRELALDQDAYYSNPNYAEDTPGKARLDSETLQIQDLQSRIDRLRQEHAALRPPQIARGSS
jgi:hypothetical protein